MDATSTIQTSQTQQASAASSPDLKALAQRLYAPVAESLEDVESLLQSELQNQYESLAPLLRHGTQLGGKRVRPAMLLLCGKAIAEVTQQHVVLAAVIEMIHTATLIHDDVLDEADTRRHVATVNARWNNHTSILFGDYLFAQSFRLAATHTSSQSCALIGEAARLVCEGELRQVLHRDVLQLDEETYFEIIQGKTAELCSVACQLGGISSNCDLEAADALKEYGRLVGIAFQIADDYLDIWGDDAEVGKTLGTDLQQGKMTLPLIRLLATASESQRREIESILTSNRDARLADIRSYLDQSDARQYTASTAHRLARKAVDALDVLPESDAKSSLQAIAHFSVGRTF